MNSFSGYIPDAKWAFLLARRNLFALQSDSGTEADLQHGSQPHAQRAHSRKGT